jgi:hypothetical protein
MAMSCWRTHTSIALQILLYRNDAEPDHAALALQHLCYCILFIGFINRFLQLWAFRNFEIVLVYHI